MTSIFTYDFLRGPLAKIDFCTRTCSSLRDPRAKINFANRPLKEPPRSLTCVLFPSQHFKNFQTQPYLLPPSLSLTSSPLHLLSSLLLFSRRVATGVGTTAGGGSPSPGPARIRRQRREEPGPIRAAGGGSRRRDFFSDYIFLFWIFIFACGSHKHPYMKIVIFSDLFSYTGRSTTCENWI